MHGKQIQYGSPTQAMGKLSLPKKPRLRNTVIVFFDWTNESQAISTLHTLKKALFQSQAPSNRTLLITFWLSRWLKKSTLQISSGMTSCIPERQDFCLILFSNGQFIQGKFGLFIFWFFIFWSFPKQSYQILVARSSTKKVTTFLWKPTWAPQEVEDTFHFKQREGEAERPQLLSELHHLKIFLPVTHTCKCT